MKPFNIIFFMALCHPIFSEIVSFISKNENFKGTVWTGYLNEDNNEQVAYLQLYVTNSPKLFVFLGSPGYSSQQFNFRGMGPEYLDDTFQRVPNQYDYSQSAQLCFLDILGAGYSRLPNDREKFTMKEYVDYYVKYLKYSLDTVYIPDWKKIQIYFIGSGWGAQVAAYVAEQFSNSKLVLLSPMLSPKNLLSQLGSLGYSLGLLDQQERTRIEGVVSAAVFAGISKQVFDEAINLIAKYSGNMQVINYLQYEIEQRNLDELKLGSFFNLEKTKELMKIFPEQTFFVHNVNVTNALEDEFNSEDSIIKISTMINAKTNILIIFNSLSLRLNYPGTLLSLNQLSWGNSNSINKAQTVYFKQTGDDYACGWQKVIDTLKVVNLFDSGENIWQDQPGILQKLILGL